MIKHYVHIQERRKTQAIIIGFVIISFIILIGAGSTAYAQGRNGDPVKTQPSSNNSRIQEYGSWIRDNEESTQTSNPYSFDPCTLADVECDGEKSLTARVTGYTSHVNQTDSTPCIAADGTDICKRYANGEKICATNDWPLRTKLTIEGLGTCTVADRMNRRYTGTGRIDWYFGMDIETAKNHGVKKLNVYESTNP